MKSRSNGQPRVELGRVTSHTRGAAFGTIEQVGLYRPASISGR